MATERGRWLRDQISARFGAWVTVVGAAPSVTCGAVWVLAVAGVVEEGVDEADSNWRAIAVKGLFERCRGRPLAAAARSREAYIVWMSVVVVMWVVGGWNRGPDPGEDGQA